jgi:hypothetical protein
MIDFPRLLSDDSFAFNFTRHYLPYQTLQAEIVKLCKWAICSGEGFFTYSRIEGSGQLTWMPPYLGTKFWTYFTPKPTIGDSNRENTGQGHRRRRLKPSAPQNTPFERYRNVLKAVQEYFSAPDTLPDFLEAHHLVRQPGSLLYVPQFRSFLATH